MLALYFSQLLKNRLSNSELISFLAILRLRFPNVFNNLAAGNLSYEELVTATGVNGVKSTDYTYFPTDSFLNMLKFLLFTDEEYNALDEKDDVRSYAQWLFRYHIGRTKVMAFFCSELSRFRTKGI